MYIESLVLNNFRNYEDQEAEFSPGLNLITGDNGQGKTNLMEAVYYLAAASSFHTHKDADIIMFDRPRAIAEGVYARNGERLTLRGEICREGARRLSVNGVRKKKISEFAGHVSAVVFTPGDLEMIKSGAAVRRAFMDGAISQLRPRYAGILAEYNRHLAQKTRILKDAGLNPSLLHTLDVFNHGMAVCGARLIRYRRSYSLGLERHAAEIYSRISGGRERMSVAYKTIDETGAQDSAEELFHRLLSVFNSGKQTEMTAAACLYGPHKDDLVVQIDGRQARAFASQGQARTAALALKLAERDMFHEDAGDYPILLLDDVLSELDGARRGYVLGRIEQGQVFITSCDAAAPVIHAGRVFYVQSGRITEI